MAGEINGNYGQIYLITNSITLRVYVGQTICTLAARLKGHRNAPKGTRLRSSMDYYGCDAFTIERLAFAKDKEELDELERHYIAEYDSTRPEFGYNFERGGAGVPRSKDAAARGGAKLRGIPLSEEHKRKISEARKGVKQSPEQIAKVRAAKIGFRHTEESRLKMSRASIGKKMPPPTQEYREKVSARMKQIWRDRKENTSKNTTGLEPVF